MLTEAFWWIDVKANNSNTVSRVSLVLFFKCDFNLCHVEEDRSEDAVDTDKTTKTDIKYLMFKKKWTDILFKVSTAKFWDPF